MSCRTTRRRFLQSTAAALGAAVLAACGATPTVTPVPPTATKRPAEATATPAPAKAPEPTKAAPTTNLPIVKEPLTLTYWVTLPASVSSVAKSYAELVPFQEKEKRTGIKIDFQHPAAGQEGEQFNLLLASGRYPDMIEWNWLGVAGGASKAIQDKVILNLNDVIDQYAPALKKYYADNPLVRKQVLTDASEQYVFPFIREILVQAGPIVRADWLAKLGLKTPRTIDDWHTMLTAFKQKDPNGNGQTDEVPFTPSSSSLLNAFYDQHLLVGAWGITMGYYNDKGVAKFGPATPQFKEFLKTMAAWYKEGLVDPDFPTTDTKLFDAKVTGNTLGAWGGGVGYGMSKFLDLVKGKDTTFDLVGLPYPVLNAGDKPELGNRANPFTGLGTAITTACKRVKEAAQWLDYNYTTEGKMLANFGLEGQCHTVVNGRLAYTPECVTIPTNYKYRLSGVAGPFVQMKEGAYAAWVYKQQTDAAFGAWAEPTNEKVWPPVNVSSDEGKKLVTIQSDMDTRLKEALLKVLTAAEPVENWDKVVQQLRQIGLDDALKIQQAALDRYTKR